MATLINNAGVQHYANKMVLAENRKVGSKSLPTALADIDNLIDEMKTNFDAEYGSALDMKLENNENIFSVGTGTNVDKRSEVENSFTDVELSGNSLVNLWVKRDGSANLNDVVNNTNNEYVGVIKAGSDCGFTSHISNIKSDTYTVIFDLKTDSTLAKPKIMFFDYGGLANAQNTTLTTTVPNTNWNTYMLTKSVTKTNGSTVLVGVNCPSSEIGIRLSVRNVMILEGDWTNKPIPQYFEGLKSIGEKEDGNHKISISSIGKNLLDIKTPKKISEGATITDNGLKINSSSNYANTIYDLNLKIGAKYKVSAFKDYGAELSIRDMTGYSHVYFESQSGFCSDNFTFEEGMTLRLGNRTILNTTLEIANIQIEEIVEYLDESTPYESYKEDKKEISLNEPLRGLPNGVKDTIEKINGEWKIVRRCGEIIFNGEENWILSDYNGETTSRYRLKYLEITDIAKKINSIGICDTIPVYSNSYWNQDFEMIENDATFINIRKKIYNNLNEFKQWLSQNPTKVVYELATPIIEDISPITLQCWKNGTIFIDEVLPVETTHTVALNKPAQIKRNIEELTVLRKRVQALEDFYDQVALEQSHQLSLLNHSIELDYDI